jgi:predicted ABC-type ATPase
MLQARGYSGFADAPLDEQSRAFLRAAEIVAGILDDCVTGCIPVGVETVLSTGKHQPLVERVLAAGGFFGLIYICLQSPDLACERVARRVRQGGHAVPTDKTRNRWHRSLGNLPWFATRASQFFIFDNSDSSADRPPILLAYGAMGTVRKRVNTAVPAIAGVLDQLPRAAGSRKS